MLTYCLDQVPFSLHGSYLAISRMHEHFDGVWIRTVRGRECLVPVLRIDLPDAGGHPAAFEERTSAGCLELREGDRYVRFAFQDGHTLRWEGNTALVLTMNPSRSYSYANEYPDGRVKITYGNEYKLMISSSRGPILLDAPFERVRCTRIVLRMDPDGEGRIDGTLEEFAAAYRPGPILPVAVCTQRAEDGFTEFLEGYPECGPDYAATREMCAFVNWASVVGPSGHHVRPAMYMSKNWMTQIWCWDRCFNVVALAQRNPSFALEQLRTFFDHQHPSGCLPDCFNDRLITWDYVKTPLEGWAILYLLTHGDAIGTEAWNELYDPLCRWTRWWLEDRDYDRDGIPQYNSGLDSGWDNNSVFAGGNLVEGPDLTAFLILQMEALEALAQRIGRTAEAADWHRQADDLLRRFLDHSWDGTAFLSRRSGTHDSTPGSDSLINFVPLILGNRLSSDVRKALMKGLREEGRFLCPFGLATESFRSPFHDPSGYWSGPVWGPAVTILVDGLLRCGDEPFAREIARRYCDNMVRHGTAENFNSTTGVGQNDRAYTWSTSAFLLLASYLHTGTW